MTAFDVAYISLLLTVNYKHSIHMEKKIFTVMRTLSPSTNDPH